MIEVFLADRLKGTQKVNISRHSVYGEEKAGTSYSDSFQDRK